jgi:hypothetical protein
MHNRKVRSSEAEAEEDSSVLIQEKIPSLRITHSPFAATLGKPHTFLYFIITSFILFCDFFCLILLPYLPAAPQLYRRRA